MAATVMQKSASYANDNDSRIKKSPTKTTNKKNKKKNNKKDELPVKQTMIKSHSYSEEGKKHTRASSDKKTTFSASIDRDLHAKTKEKRPRRGRRRGQTNKFMSSVNVGQTVKLSEHRIGFVRYKGKVKFGVGTWYGLEIYDSFTKTRHNGTVYGKRYYNCPRNKGLFVKREIILNIIKPQHIKNELQKLELEQIKKKKQKDLQKKKAAAAEQRIAIDTRKGMGLTHNNNQHSMLAQYQKQVYGNNKLILKITNEKNDSIEDKIHKDFKRFQRLSFRASHNPEIFSIMMDNDNDANEEKDSKQMDGEEDMLPEGVDIDAEAWDSVKEKPIIEVLDEDKESDDEDICTVRLFYPLPNYFSEYEYVFNKGIFIKEIHHHSKQGRALILECGVQSNDGWYLTEINEENIKKFSKEAVDEILDKLLPDIGYDVVLKRE